MANIEKLKFPALKIIGANYIAWTTDVELHLEMQDNFDTIKVRNESLAKDKAKAIIFLKKHLDENVTHDYAHIKDPAELWVALKERFDNQREITLSHALEEWRNMRFHDFLKVNEYNSSILRIVSQLKYYGKPVTEAEMLENTYQTFHKDHRLLQELYKSREYTRFSELMVTLRLAEKNSELLIQNYNSRPTGTHAFLEVNAADVKNPKRENQTFVVMAVNLIMHVVEELTTHEGEDRSIGFVPNKILRGKNTKKIPPRSVIMCDTDAGLKDISPIHVESLITFVSYTWNPSKENGKK